MPIQTIKERLQELRECCKEENLEPINEESLSFFREFMEFLQTCGNLESNPTILLTPDHRIYATWKQKSKKYCFKFRPDGKIRFFVIRKKNENRTKRI